MAINCSVCFEDIDFSNEEVSVLKCGHLFHQECLRRWFDTSRTCPECRSRVTRNQFVKKIFPKISRDAADEYSFASDETKNVFKVFEDQTKMLKNVLFDRVLSVEKELIKANEKLDIKNTNLEKVMEEKQSLIDRNQKIELDLENLKQCKHGLLTENEKLKTKLEKNIKDKQSTLNKIKKLQQDLKKTVKTNKNLLSKNANLELSLKNEVQKKFDALKKIKLLENDIQNLNKETRRIKENNNQLKIFIRNSFENSKTIVNNDRSIQMITKNTNQVSKELCIQNGSFGLNVLKNLNAFKQKENVIVNTKIKEDLGRALHTNQRLQDDCEYLEKNLNNMQFYLNFLHDNQINIQNKLNTVVELNKKLKTANKVKDSVLVKAAVLANTLVHGKFDLFTILTNCPPLKKYHRKINCLLVRMKTIQLMLLFLLQVSRYYL